MIIKKLKNSGFIAFLLLLISLTGILSYQNHIEYTALKNAFFVERKELNSELNNILKDYAKVLYQKNNASLNLRNKLHEIIKLKDTINNLKTSDYNLLRFYRRRIFILNQQNKILFSYIDSLNLKNNQLLTKNDSVRDVLIKKSNQNNKLKYKNYTLYKEKKNLKEKIAIAEIIEISTPKINAIKEKRNGKQSTTSRARKTNGFKISFNILENKIIERGLKNIHIQIIHKNKVIFPTEKIRLKSKQKIFYNQKISIEYNNKLESINSFISLNNNKINKGIYIFNIFIDGVFIKNTSIQLK